MLSAVLYSIRSYPAYPIGIRTGTPVVCFSKSSRIMEKSFQYSIAYIRYRPNCLCELSFIKEGADYTFIFLLFRKELPYYNHPYVYLPLPATGTACIPMDDYPAISAIRNQSSIRIDPSLEEMSTKSLRG